MRRVLLITGMHRSGTSFLAECMSLLGWALPSDRGGPSHDNPRGHFEPAAVVGLNTAVMRNQGTGWDRFSPLSDEETAAILKDGYCGRLSAALAASFGEAADCLVKDPRFGLLHPLWQAWAGERQIEVSVAVALRHPQSVAASLRARDGISEDLALMSWVAHTLGALALAAENPSAVLPFPDWTAEPEAFAARLGALGRRPAAGPAGIAGAIGATFLPDAVHQDSRCRSRPHNRSARAPRLGGDIGRLASALHERARAWAVLDQRPESGPLSAFRAEYDRLRRLASAVEARASRALRTAAAGQAETEARLGAAQSDCRSARTEAALNRASAAAAQVHLAATESQRDALAAQVRDRLADTAALRDQVAATERQRDVLAAQLRDRLADTAALRDHVAATERQRDLLALELEARLADNLALGRQIAATESQRDGLSRQAAEQLHDAELLRRQVAATEAQRESAVTEIAHLRTLADRTERALLSSTRQIARLERDGRSLRTDLADATKTGERLQNDLDAVRAAANLQAARSLACHADLCAQRKDSLTIQEQVRTASDRAAQFEQLYREERMTILKPVYRRLYHGIGRRLRQALPERRVERVKRWVPSPDGIPARLAERLPSAPAPGTPGDQAIRAREGGAADIIVLSIINWDFRTQRPQHLARDWARRGHRVFYVEMECDRSGPQRRRIADNLYVLRLGAGDGDGELIRTYGGVPDRSQARAWVGAVLGFAETVGLSPEAHVVLQHPYWWHFARHLPPAFRLTFDCMDDISGFSNTEPHMLEAERDMIAGCDRMIASSQHLADRHRATRAVTLVRNAADPAHFSGGGRTAAAPPFIARRFRLGASLRAGYVGAIAEWFDVALIRDAASLAPDVDFHLCGGVTDPSALTLEDLPNVFLHGEISYDDVPGFLNAMDVMTIPFRLSPIIEACDPVKFYEYAAAGKPVVATDMPELVRAGDLVLRVEDAAGFAAGVRAAAARRHDPGHVRALEDYARRNSWTDRGGAFLTAMTAAPTVSIVILAYGPAELTKTAVHALTGGGGTQPPLEIIVVDNGSPAEDILALRIFLSALPQVRLIENGRNLGFAGGNNIGIAAATGDYVMLLNNDTFVAPGAIPAMIRHLEHSPEIGVIGPLTNSIGNEARVDVNYSDMDGMRRAALDLTSGYRGRWSEIAVVAYFCAMFRRADLAVFGPLDESFGRGMFEDDDHCAAIRAHGYVCALAEDAFVHHHLSATFNMMGADEKRGLFERNKAIYEARWGRWRPHAHRTARPAGSLEAA